MFGAAHMVGFYQRVSSFVLRVAAFRLDVYDDYFAISAARRAWVAWRAAQIGSGQRPRFEMIYLDDAAGLLTPPRQASPIMAVRGDSEKIDISLWSLVVALA